MNNTEGVEVSFGSLPIYVFRDVFIDEKIGYPILIQGKIAGGILTRKRKLIDFIMIDFLAIEIKEEYRRKGLASAIVKQCLLEGDVINGGIDKKSAIPFWQKMGARFFEPPKESIPDFVKESEVTIAFYVTRNERVAKIYEDKLLAANYKVYTP